MMTNLELADKLRDIAENYKTLYILGCFGAPMTDARKQFYTQNYKYNMQADRTAMIRNASADTFGFDCVCLIKGVLWGWNGDLNGIHGGACYLSNDVPDITADSMIMRCTDVSTDFSEIWTGEVVWMDEHVGVYVGNGLVIESTCQWDNGVQFTACNRDIPGYHRRDWIKHGKLPYVSYVKQSGTSADMVPNGSQGDPAAISFSKE